MKEGTNGRIGYSGLLAETELHNELLVVPKFEDQARLEAFEWSMILARLMEYIGSACDFLVRFCVEHFSIYVVGLFVEVEGNRFTEFDSCLYSKEVCIASVSVPA